MNETREQKRVRLLEMPLALLFFSPRKRNTPFALSPIALIWSRSLRSAAACWRWLASLAGISRNARERRKKNRFKAPNDSESENARVFFFFFDFFLQSLSTCFPTRAAPPAPRTPGSSLRSSQDCPRIALPTRGSRLFYFDSDRSRILVFFGKR